MATSNRPGRPWGWALAGAFALAQPASAALFGNAELERQTLALQQQTQALQKQVDALDGRLAKLETALQNNRQMLEMLQQVEALKAEIASLRGQSEVQKHQLDTMGKRQNDLYADLDQRLSDLARAAQPASAASSQPDAQAESQSYDAALKLFREKDYAAAITGFKEFLQTYPDSAMAANAQYWIGYSYYAQKDYKTSLATQQKLVATYPASPKVPDALLNVAASQIAMDNLDGARKTLKELVAKYPGTEAAKLAARRLSALK